MWRIVLPEERVDCVEEESLLETELEREGLRVCIASRGHLPFLEDDGDGVEPNIVWVVCVCVSGDTRRGW